jgi:hypothetical protein
VVNTRSGAVLLALALALVAACTSSPGGSGAAASGSGSTAGSSVAPAPVAEGPITSSGPVGWNRGPYQLAGGTYELSWTSDGGCSVLYFGLEGADNSFTEPPSAGDVPLAEMASGTRTIEDVPPGSYFFNVSGMACKEYSATLTRKP